MLMTKKLFLIIISTTTLAFFVPLNLKAQTPSPEVAGEKIDEIRKQVEESVKTKLDEIINKQERRGWVGKISEVNAIGFQIETNGEVRSVTLNDQAVIINQNRQTITLENLETGQRVIAMGEAQIDGSLDAKRVVITGEQEADNRQPIFGEIAETAAQDQIILVKNKDQSYELIFDENSLLKQRFNSEIEEINYRDLTSNQKIVAVISPLEGNTATYRVNELLVITLPESTPAPSPDQPEEE